MTLNRRAAIGRMFGAALAAPTAAQQLAQTLMSPRGPWQSGLLGASAVGGDMAPPAAPSSSTGILDLVLTRARAIFRSRARESEVRHSYRAGRFDHDVHVMGSWSLAYKAAVQRSRDEAEESVLDQLRREAWPDRED